MDQAKKRVIIVEARFYVSISDNLAEGATAVLDDAGVVYERISVPGILEIPSAVDYVLRSDKASICDGFIVLGCAIKGQTDHYDHVARACFDGLMELTLGHSLAIGNGILTCHHLDHAIERADPQGRNYGGKAAKACLRMMELQTSLQV